MNHTWQFSISQKTPIGAGVKCLEGWGFVLCCEIFDIDIDAG